MSVALRGFGHELPHLFCPPRLDYAGALGILPQHIWHAQQVHGAKVAQVSGKPESDNQVVAGADGLFSCASGTAMRIRTADCGPLLLWHQKGAVGVIHAGRAGLNKGIIEESVGIFSKNGFEAEELRAWFAPSLGPCCHEVQHRIHMDMWECAKNRLLALKLKRQNIRIEMICTACNQRAFASFRAMGDDSGDNILVAAVP